MKTKFSIVKDQDKKKLVITEYAELDKDNQALLCKQSYDDEIIRGSKTKKEMINLLRTNNLFPPSNQMDDIAQAVMNLYESDSTDEQELNFDDIDMFIDEEEEIDEIEETAEAADDIDDLLDDDADSSFEDDIEIKKKLVSPIKIADEEDSNIETVSQITPVEG